MFRNLKFSKERKYHILSIIIGTLIGIFSIYLCIYLKLEIFGFNFYLIISPLIAGFVETYLSQYLTKKSSGAISAIILFIVTNAIGWLFPSNPIKWNFFTIGGLLVMLQAAFPLTINCILAGIVIILTTNFGRIIKFLRKIFRIEKKSKPIPLSNIDLEDNVNVLILNNHLDIQIKEYHGVIFAEEVIEFHEISNNKAIEYMGSSLVEKKKIKHDDYLKAKEFIINELKENAVKINANAIIDLKIEYTNYNQQIPPDMLIIAYGTAVTIDDKYLN